MEKYQILFHGDGSSTSSSSSSAAAAAAINSYSFNLAGGAHSSTHFQVNQAEVIGTDATDQNNMKLGKKQEDKKNKKIKKQKYAFQTRSQVDILDDGYRWRKYGQKTVKDNRFPRSYYRCTYKGCNVKKQIQRLSKDEQVVVTTYEGMHTHPIENPAQDYEQSLRLMQTYTPI
ncbi:WRKY transcription factor [Quillaja saponaria]|uniref:WRKY transcription factor n=1 Tax=Quillaja saponaria TaxID=32244 RepID=A0AAD7KTY1_QUISA|nr:WRKY transcription factor [Quillaja saponaria]